MVRIKKVKSQNRYPDDFKRKVALEYLSGRFSYAVAAEEYGLSGKAVVREFVFNKAFTFVMSRLGSVFKFRNTNLHLPAHFLES